MALAWPKSMLHAFAEDLRFAVRTLRHSPGFTAVAVAVLAIGIGANTAIFSVVNEVLLRPLPYADADRLVRLWARDARLTEGRSPVVPADYLDWKAQSRSYSAMAASSDGVFNLTGEGDPEMLNGYRFAPEMFGVLGVQPARGRAFTADDGEHVAVLSHDLWTRRFGADPAVVGRKIQLNQTSYEVVGVMPPSFAFPKRTALWVPLVIPPELATSRDQPFIRIVARLAPGATVASAGRELSAIAGRLAAENPATNQNRAASLTTLRELHAGDVQTPLLVLGGAVGFLLLLACANVAGLVVARTAGRQRELAVRVALGATRGRLVRQLLTETAVLALAGGAVGVVLASWSVGLLVGLFPQKLGNVSIPDVKQIPLDAAVVAFSLAVSALSAFLSGLVPALAATRTDVERSLREAAVGEPPRAARLRRWLVGAELVLATVIVVGAALLARSSWHQARADLGFDADGLLTARLFLAETRYPSPQQRQAFVAGVMEQLRANPAVASAGAVSTLPLSGWWAASSFFLEGRPEDSFDSAFLIVEPGYFPTMRIPLLQGRMFAPSDGPNAPAVILIDGRFARRYFPGQDPLGKRLNFGTAEKPEWRTIIGVVGDVSENGPAQEARPTIYISFAQRDWPLLGLVVRGTGDPASLTGALRSATWAVDNQQPLSYVMTGEALRSDVLAVSRVTALLFAFFAATALVLGALGVYGITASAVARKTREIGVRMALGARRGDVLRWVFRQSLPVALVGLAVGLLVAIALSRVLRGFLHGVTATDPLAILGAVAILGTTAFVASYLPARRAARLDPAKALRTE